MEWENRGRGAMRNEAWNEGMRKGRKGRSEGRKEGVMEVGKKKKMGE